MALRPPPSNLTAFVISSTCIRLTWTNEAGYIFIEINRKLGAGAYGVIDTISGSLDYYYDESCAVDSQYTYKIRGKYFLHGVWYWTIFSNEAVATTFETLWPPTDIAAFPISDTEIDITFKDNSAAEEWHRLERNPDGAGWELVADLDPNVEFCRDTGRATGVDYLYRVRAQVDDISEWTDWNTLAAAVQTIVTPGAPTNLAISEVQDKSMRLNWTDNATTETGFKVEISDDGLFAGEEVIKIIGADITTFLVVDLDPSTQYWFRVCAYNAAGDSAYTAEEDDTTLAAYVPTEFEKWIRSPDIKPVYLAEIYTKMDLTGFTLDSGVVWKKTIGASDRGIDILEVFEDGDTYVEKTSIATVQATAKTFWFDYDNRTLYVHTTGGADPAGFLIEGAFWLYFSTHKDIEFTVDSGRLHHYLPFLAKENIPDITQEIKPYFEGSFSISSGLIAFLNAKIMGEHFFDKKFETYTWENSKVVLKAGSPDFTYVQFKKVFTSYIDEKGCNDNKITFSLRDVRQEMAQELVLEKYALVDLGPGDDDKKLLGKTIPLAFGSKDRVIPACVDWGNRKFNYQNGRSKSVETVTRNGTLVSDTDYYVDLQNSIITFKRDDFDLSDEDIIEISFYGSVNSANEVIDNGADIFKQLMNSYFNLPDSRLNLDSIYATKYANETDLSVFFYKDTTFDEIVRTIEHTVRAFTFQDNEGRLGINPQQTAVASNVKYIGNHQIFEHSQSQRRNTLIWKVNVNYNENPYKQPEQQWETVSAQTDAVFWRTNIKNELEIDTYFSGSAPAQALADAILNLLNKETISNMLPMLLFGTMPGDLVKFSRDRFYNSSGVASEITLRIIKISKSPASGKTTITAEEV